MEARHLGGHHCRGCETCPSGDGAGAVTFERPPWNRHLGTGWSGPPGGRVRRSSGGADPEAVIRGRPSGGGGPEVPVGVGGRRCGPDGPAPRCRPQGDGPKAAAQTCSFGVGGRRCGPDGPAPRCRPQGGGPKAAARRGRPRRARPEAAVNVVPAGRAGGAVQPALPLGRHAAVAVAARRLDSSSRAGRPEVPVLRRSFGGAGREVECPDQAWPAPGFLDLAIRPRPGPRLNRFRPDHPDPTPAHASTGSGQTTPTPPPPTPQPVPARPPRPSTSPGWNPAWPGLGLGWSRPALGPRVGRPLMPSWAGGQGVVSSPLLS
jgi:hypothetical protein